MSSETQEYHWLNISTEIALPIILQGNIRFDSLVTLGFERKDLKDRKSVNRRARELPITENPKTPDYLRNIGRTSPDYRLTHVLEQRTVIPIVAVKQIDQSSYAITAAMASPINSTTLRVIHGFEPHIPRSIAELYDIPNASPGFASDQAQWWGTVAASKIQETQQAKPFEEDEVILLWRALKLWEQTPLSPHAAQYFWYCYEYAKKNQMFCHLTNQMLQIITNRFR